MASIRRTLSPVPKAGSLLNGEVCQVPSPLSKSSPGTPTYPACGGMLSSIFGLSDSQSFVFGILSLRSSRFPERTKPKGQIWRRALFHFLACFVVGVFIGLTPFVTMNLSSNLVSKSQVFSFEVVSNVEKFHSFEGMAGNVTPKVDSGGVGANATLEVEAKEQKSVDEVYHDISLNQSLPVVLDPVDQKLLIIVTPAYPRPFQAYYLNRLAQTLRLVQPPLLWIVVEMTTQSEQTADLLRRTGVMYRHLVCRRNVTDIEDRSVHERNVALSHIETHRLDGIVYFADDYNVYSSDIFEQMRQIRRFGTWTVAKLTENESKVALKGPICNGTQVIGWHVDESWRRFQRFHADMGGFAFNSTIIWDQKRWHRPTPEPVRLLDAVKDGFQTTAFIEQVVEDESQMECLLEECLLEDCLRIMVWRLQLESPRTFYYPPKWFINSKLGVISELTSERRPSR